MSVKIFFNGIEMHVPTGEVGAVMHQLQQMTSTVNQKVPDLFEAQSLHSAKAIADATTKKQQAHNAVIKATVDLLTGIKQAGESGMDSAGVARLLGANHPKGIGSKLVAVNKIIESHGYQLESIYTNARDPLGERQWKEGVMLNSALAAIEKGGNTN